MKNLSVTILSFLYLLTSTGTTIHLHYCMGKLADWGLGHNNSETCGNCGMEKSQEKDNDCCKDEYKFIKNDGDQKKAEAGFQIIQMLASALPVSHIEISSARFPSVTEENPISHAPLRSRGVGVYILNRTFLI